MRHEIEERQSRANRREEEGNARDGDLRIDLASGVAVIGIPARGPDESSGDDSPAAVQSPPVAAHQQSAGARSAAKSAPAGPAPVPPRVDPARKPNDDRQNPRRSGTNGRGARTDESRTAITTEPPRPVARPVSKASRSSR